MSKLSPNKQNLIVLKNQLNLTRGGYGLLKEKRAGLIANFLDICRDGKEIELQINQGLKGLIQKYFNSINFINLKELSQALNNPNSSKLTLKKKKISGVTINDLEIKIDPPKNPNLKVNINETLTQFATLFPSILGYIQLKIDAQIIAHQIIKTSRQISSLETKIKEIKDDIKYIRNALMQKENFEKAVLLKIFK